MWTGNKGQRHALGGCGVSLGMWQAQIPLLLRSAGGELDIGLQEKDPLVSAYGVKKLATAVRKGSAVGEESKGAGHVGDRRPLVKAVSHRHWAYRQAGQEYDKDCAPPKDPTQESPYSDFLSPRSAWPTISCGRWGRIGQLQTLVKL